MKSLMKPKPGDLFYIPSISQSNENGFVIARYIEFIKPNLGHLIEVFDHFYTEPPKSISDVDTSKRLFQPIFCSMRFAADIPRWKILFGNPEYDKSESNYKDITFVFDRSLWVGGETKGIETDEMQNIEPSICWRMDHIIFRVLNHLKGFLSNDEVMDYDKIPMEYRQDNEIAQKRVNEIAEIMHDKFKSWG
ncbi:Imm26 family immunity protein [Chryseobacterium viscerum]|uniref:Immunity protein 26 n=1 Tax=Chryseobacterium viscerum TaxID=1037377 RepID=A0A316WIK7_9FLAO|nr:Imm26 family immunity protein [Chryseobacterium viscerum]PWN61204.1 hypothetical protein C1634_014200 [Chryseobacterium viscerum]